MQLFFIGCEYSGTTTIYRKLDEGLVENIGAQGIGYHDHWKIPEISGHPPHETSVTILTEEEQEQVYKASPVVKELLMRYALYYHSPQGPQPIGTGSARVGYYFDELIYAPRYYGYGGEGELGDRRIEANKIETILSKYAPDLVLILVTCSPETIIHRKKTNPHPNEVVPEQDIPLILDRFQEEFNNSKMKNKISIDTTSDNIDQSVKKLAKKIEPYLSHEDRLKLLLNQLK